MAAKQTHYDADLEVLTRQAERLQERIGLLQRLRDLELEDAGVVPAKQTATPGHPGTAPVTAAPAKKRAGRPKATKAGVPTEDGKMIDLPTLLETIGQNLNKPITLPDFVTLVRQYGYTTKAKDFSNMVYQSLLKLVKRGKFKKNDETRCYEYIGKAA
jgi:hypothetical protein